MKSILARSLFKSYDGINAVDGIDLDVDEGQIFGFLGPNGAGTVSYTHLTLPTKA